MKKIILVSICFLLVGCSQSKRTTGTTMELNLPVPSSKYLWRCISNDEFIISLSEENYKQDKSNKKTGTYIYSFTGIKHGNTSIICTYTIPEENTRISDITYEISVNDYGYITMTNNKSNNLDIEIPNPIFR